MEIFSFYSQEILEKLLRKEVRYFVGSCLLCLLAVCPIFGQTFSDLSFGKKIESSKLISVIILKYFLRYLFDFRWVGSFLFSVLILEAYLIFWLTAWSVIFSGVALLIF